MAALNHGIAEWNVQAGQGKAIQHLAWDTVEHQREARRWSNRIDDGVGYVRSHADCQRAVRRKLG